LREDFSLNIVVIVATNFNQLVPFSFINLIIDNKLLISSFFSSFSESLKS
jgi:hypothetical protein